MRIIQTTQMSSKRYVASLVMLFICVLSAHCKMYGLFYGNNGLDLSCAESDMRTLAKMYRAHDGDVVLMLGTKISKDKLLEALSDQCDACCEDDILIFAQSGHGCDKGIICGTDEVATYDEIKNLVGLCQAKRRVLMFGCCRSGNAKDKNKGYIKRDSDEQVLIISSSRDWEDSYEVTGDERHSFYISIAEAFKGKADYDKNGIITAHELYKYLSSDNSFISKPTFYGHFSNDMALYSCKGLSDEYMQPCGRYIMRQEIKNQSNVQGTKENTQSKDKEGSMLGWAFAALLILLFIFKASFNKKR